MTAGAVLSPAVPTARTTGFAVTAVLAEPFTGGTERCGDPQVATDYFRAMLRGAGVALDEPRLRSGMGHSYGQMASATLGRLVAGGPRPGLVVLGHAPSDLNLHEIATQTAMAAIGGGVEGFAVADHGRSTAVTALDLATVLGRRRGYRHLAVILLDQPVRPYADPSEAEDVVHGAWAVGLLLASLPDGSEDEPGGLRHLSVPVGPDGLAATADRVCDGLTEPGAVAAQLYVDDQLAQLWPAAADRGASVGPAGQPTCSAWIAAATAPVAGPIDRVLLTLDRRRGRVTGAAYRA